MVDCHFLPFCSIDASPFIIYKNFAKILNSLFSCNFVIIINKIWTLSCYKIISFLFFKSKLFNFVPVWSYLCCVTVDSVIKGDCKSKGDFMPLFIVSQKFILLISYNFFACKFMLITYPILISVIWDLHSVKVLSFFENNIK